jgi:endonuclease-3
MSQIREAVKILARDYGEGEWWGKYTPFETLVSIILSQKTYWKNVRTATRRFGQRFGGVKEVAEAGVEEIEEAIKPAGLYRMKAPRIKDITQDLVEKYDGSLDEITRLPYPEARKRLISIRGIGPKTADVFLMAISGEPVLPIDVHIFRIMRRLGIADEKDDYERLRAKLEREIPSSERRRAHLALIEFGRRVCRPRQPKCSECPIRRYCRAPLAGPA